MMRNYSFGPLELSRGLARFAERAKSVERKGRSFLWGLGKMGFGVKGGLQKANFTLKNVLKISKSILCYIGLFLFFSSLSPSASK